MPEIDIYQYLVQQGGWAVLALTMFLLSRKDSQQAQEKLNKLVERSHEQVEMFLRFGQERGKLEQHIADTLDEIKVYLGRVQLCPVTMMSQDDIKELARADPTLTRAKAAQLIRDHLKNHTEK